MFLNKYSWTLVIFHFKHLSSRITTIPFPASQHHMVANFSSNFHLWSWHFAGLIFCYDYGHNAVISILCHLMWNLSLQRNQPHLWRGNDDGFCYCSSIFFFFFFFVGVLVPGSLTCQGSKRWIITGKPEKVHKPSSKRGS